MSSYKDDKLEDRKNYIITTTIFIIITMYMCFGFYILVQYSDVFRTKIYCEEAVRHKKFTNKDMCMQEANDHLKQIKDAYSRK